MLRRHLIWAIYTQGKTYVGMWRLKRGGGGCLLEGGVFSGTYGIGIFNCHGNFSQPEILVQLDQNFP